MVNAKKVWGIILIVLGVIFFLSGIVGFYETSFYGNEIEIMNRMIKRHGGKIGNQFLNSERYEEVVQMTKVINIIMSLLGIAGAVSGTLMLKNPQLSNALEDEINEFEINSSEKEKWLF
jgi:hypothetical protein